MPRCKSLPYNRTVKDLAGQSPEALLAATAQMPAWLCRAGAAPFRIGRGRVSMYLAGPWHAIALPAPPRRHAVGDTLDVEVLQQRVLQPLLKVGDPRTDKRIEFVGGIRGTGELERLVNSRQGGGGVLAVPGQRRRPDGHRRRRRHHAAEVHVVRTEAARRVVGASD